LIIILKACAGDYKIDGAINTGLFARNYTFTYLLTIKGFYAYEIALIALGGVIIIASAIFVFVWFAGKKRSFADLGRAVKGIFVHEKTVIKTVEVIKEVPPHHIQPLPMEELTPREKEVAELLLLGKSRREIAKALFVSENTVKTHAQNVFSKCGVTSQKAFIAKYILGDGRRGKNSFENMQ